MVSKRNLFRSLGIITGSFMLGFLSFWWFQYDISSQAAKVQTIKSNISRDINLVSDLATLKTQSQQATTYEQRLSSLLPQKDKLIDFDNFLEVLASQRGASIDFAFNGAGSPVGEGGLSQIPFNLSVTGPLSAIQGLLQDIEVKPRAYLLSLDDVSLGRSDAGYQAFFHGKLYYREADNQ